MEGNGIVERVTAWAGSGGDFIGGLSLFLTWNRNVFYVRNIEAKGKQKGMVTLVSEFARKIKVSEAALWGMIEGKDDGQLGIRQLGIKQKAFEDVPDRQTEEAEGRREKVVKLREEFPFLGKKDCPPVMAVLVNRMLTAYDDYRQGHKGLFAIDVNDFDQCYQGASGVLETYILNRQIWDELNYYKLNGTVLGNMPEFKEQKLKENYLEIGTVKLVRIMSHNIPRRISYYKQQLKDEGTRNKEAIREKMIEAEREVLLIQEILKERGEI